ncbi:hypothetical protein SAMN02745206_00185 [Desulfacinum infernum DSM 9756]|uniref:Uncharacterized protein n=1 Tax=Desulfacinum infernum DSM 9756 TaxID=1121391 RepID=A0A1M4SU26_9BACT|nr:hypothetical protein SAMN02745206_00185 [Desulfacinum infernum DSM 9756]
MRRTVVVGMILFLAASTMISCAARTAKIDHYLTYTNKGTRSEARHGHLVVNGKEIPWCFDRVAAAGRSFSFRVRTNLWGDDGYFPDASPWSERTARTDIAPSELTRGYYVGDERLSGTPSSWIFVEWSGKGAKRSAFVDPLMIERLIQDFKIPVRSGVARMRIRLTD